FREEKMTRKRCVTSKIIRDMKRSGHTEKQIAQKMKLPYQFVRGVSRLLKRGEIRLLLAVEAGDFPVNTALELSQTDHAGGEKVLQSCYEKNLLAGRKLLAARRLLRRRQWQGKAPPPVRRYKKRYFTSKVVIRACQDDADKRQSFIRKAGE